uniref:Autophagy-related protein n=1 Tax=Panagrellus redivivus TaxID=6233 RepID=A0A7E4VTW9_PANRE
MNSNGRDESDEDGDWKLPRSMRVQKRQPNFDFGTLEEPRANHALQATPQPEMPRTLYAFHAHKASKWWSSMVTRGSRKRKKVVQSFELQDSNDFPDENADHCADNGFDYDSVGVDYKPDMNVSFKTDAATQTDGAKEKAGKSSAKFNWGFEISCFFVACTYAVLFNWFFVGPWLHSG